MENRAEWLKWRHQGIGSSDAPVVMGVSPWKTEFQLWEEKIQPEPPKQTGNTWILDKGNRMEPKIRALFEMQENDSFDAALCQMENYPYIRASLDGRNPNKDTIIEIKLVGAADRQTVTAGKVPEKYLPQVQHQLMVSQAKRCFFLAYEDVDKNETISAANLAKVVVIPDVAYQEKMLGEEIRFWDYVQKRKPVPIAAGDFKTLKGVTKEINKWKRLKQKANALEHQLDELKSVILKAAESANHPRLMASGVTIVKVARTGNVQYAKIPQLQGVDLDQYRGAGSTYWKIGEE